MSAMSEMARSKAKAKAERLVRGQSGDIDASGWREPTDQLGMIQTGPRPVSSDKGAVEVKGIAGVGHAGRKPRATGGRALINDWVNSNVKDANESRVGQKHVGGMASGGHVKGCDCAKCSGGRVGKARGGSLDGRDQGMRPQGGRLARKGGGRTKKGMNVNIIIAPNSPSRPPMPPPGALPPPAGGPVGLHQGAPPPMMPPGAGAPPPAGAPPMMPRATGGRASDGVLAKMGKYPLKDGGGGGLGRLEKAKAYGNNAASLK
jgi:hypothetical protein